MHKRKVIYFSSTNENLDFLPYDYDWRAKSQNRVDHCAYKTSIFSQLILIGKINWS